MNGPPWGRGLGIGFRTVRRCGWHSRMESASASEADYSAAGAAFAVRLALSIASARPGSPECARQFGQRRKRVARIGVAGADSGPMASSRSSSAGAQLSGAGALILLASLWLPWYAIRFPAALRDAFKGLGSSAGQGSAPSGSGQGFEQAFAGLLSGIAAALPDEISAKGWTALDGADVALAAISASRSCSRCRSAARGSSAWRPRTPAAVSPRSARSRSRSSATTSSRRPVTTHRRSSARTSSSCATGSPSRPSARSACSPAA